MLDTRLQGIAQLIRPGSRVADIGTDHAHLPVWLVEQGICPSAIASDLRAGPAAAAKKNITAAGLTDRIAVRIGDGLQPIRPGEAEDLVIAGMGGETIAGILAGAAWAKDGRYRWILQPMTRPEELRRYLLTNGYHIEQERIIQEDHRLYVVMTAVYTAAEPVEEEAAYYIGGLTPKEGRAFLIRQRMHLRRRADGLAHRTASEDERERLYRLADQLMEYTGQGQDGKASPDAEPTEADQPYGKDADR